MDHTPGFLAVVEDARTRVRETTVADVKRRLDGAAAGAGAGTAATAGGTAPFHLVDVREESEWGRGHLPGAIHIGKGVIERDIERMIPDLDAPIVLYCGGGYRSVLAADMLQRMGYTSVESMDGGWRGWTEAGYDVE